MTVFRKRPHGFRFVSPPEPPILDVVVNEKSDGVNVIRHEVVVARSVEEWHEEHPIPMEDYSIGQQIDSGVSLKDIPCSTRLDSGDNLDYPENENAEEKVLEVLSKTDDVNE